MVKTLVGVFDDKSAAQTVVRELQGAGIPGSQVRLMDNSDATAPAGATGAPASAGTTKSAGTMASPGASTGTTTESELPWTERVGNWFNSLFEDDADRSLASNYTEAWRRGSFIVVADVDEVRVNEVVRIMNRYGTVDLNRRAKVWEKTGYTGTPQQSAQLYSASERERELSAYGEEAKQGEAKQGEAIPVVQEELSVGKRVVQRGGVRIHSYVTERPVEELVRLREEHVNVQRRPVDRPAATADMAFQDKTIDVTASSEEAVVQKRARVVEEVVVGKNVQEREETVRETVRRKDVSVEQLAQQSPAQQNPAQPDLSQQNTSPQNAQRNAPRAPQQPPRHR